MKLTHQQAASHGTHNNVPVNDPKWLNDLRVSYEVDGIDMPSLLPTPLGQFEAWLAAAVAAKAEADGAV